MNLSGVLVLFVFFILNEEMQQVSGANCATAVPSSLTAGQFCKYKFKIVI